MIKTIKEMFEIKRKQLLLEKQQTKVLQSILNELVKLNEKRKWQSQKNNKKN